MILYFLCGMITYFLAIHYHGLDNERSKYDSFSDIFTTLYMWPLIILFMIFLYLIGFNFNNNAGE